MNKSKLIAICCAVVVSFVIVLAVMFADSMFKSSDSSYGDSVKYVIKFDRGGQPLSAGTAFVTNGKGVLVTNAHVAGTKVAENQYTMPDASEILYIIYAKQLKHRKVAVLQRAIVEKISSGLDLARLRVVSPDRTDFFPLALAKGCTAGESATALGYPAAYDMDDNQSELLKNMYRDLILNSFRQMPDRIELEWNDAVENMLKLVHKPGNVNQIRHGKLFDESTTDCDIVVHDATLAQGMSGGPLLNKDGQVIGVNSRFLVGKNVRIDNSVHVNELKNFLNEEDYIEGSINPFIYKIRVFLQHASTPTIVMTIISLIMVIGGIFVLVRLLPSKNEGKIQIDPLPVTPEEGDGPTIPVGVGGASHSGEPSIVLIGTGPDNTPLRFRIPQSELMEKSSILIGRSKTCRIQLPFNTVSRQHATISYRQDSGGNGYVYLRDLKASNKTLVNGKPITSRSLTPGDTITLASVKLRLTVEK